MTEPAPLLPARFELLRRASRAKRALLILFGPLIWVVALVVLAFVLGESAAVEYALAVFAASFVLAAILLALTRRARLREERDA